MKKVILLFLFFIISLVGCEASSTSWIVNFYDNDILVDTLNIKDGSNLELIDLEHEYNEFIGWTYNDTYVNTNYIVNHNLDLYSSWNIVTNEVSDLLYTVENNEITITGITKSVEVLQIPSMIDGVIVTTIGSYAFNGNTSITNILLPNTIVEIEEYAFIGCSNLLSINFEEGLNKIGTHAFAYCPNLKSIYIPVSVSIIEMYAFRNCYTLTIYANLEEQSGWENNWNDGNVIYNYLNKEFVTVSGVTYLIENNEAILIKGSNSETLEIQTDVYYNNVSYDVTTIADNAFYFLINLKSIVFPVTLKEINDNAFAYCLSLKNIIISSNVVSIGDNAFYACTNLETVVLNSNLEEIGESAFSNCISLKNITIPSKVKTIKKETFNNCISLASLNLNEGLESIEENITYLCDSLVFIIIPSSVLYIKENAFYAMTNCILCFIGDYKEGYEEGFNFISPIVYNYESREISIQNGITYLIEDNEAVILKVFTSNDIVVPQTIIKNDVTYDVTTVDSHAFAYCKSLSVILPDTLTTINKEAFYKYTSLESIFIPSNVLYIKEDAFLECNMVIYTELSENPLGWENNWNNDCTVIYNHIS